MKWFLHMKAWFRREILHRRADRWDHQYATGRWEGKTFPGVFEAVEGRDDLGKVAAADVHEIVDVKMSDKWRADPNLVTGEDIALQSGPHVNRSVVWCLISRGNGETLGPRRMRWVMHY